MKRVSDPSQFADNAQANFDNLLNLKSDSSSSLKNNIEEGEGSNPRRLKDLESTSPGKNSDKSLFQTPKK